MFEHFNDEARRVVVIAQEYARALYHVNITPEHLLLAAIHHTDSAPAAYLTEAGVDVDALRERVRQVIGFGPHPPTGHIPFTGAARQVMVLAETARSTAVQTGIGDLQLLGVLSAIQ